MPLDLFLSTLSLRRATSRAFWRLPGFMTFLSTLSLRRATLLALLRDLLHHNFYPRSPCGERLTSEVSDRVPLAISIHALLAESDVSITIIITCTALFLSTLSLRRATISTRREANESIDFYPRSPCGERRRQGCRLGARVCISIHALLAESDFGRAFWPGLSL